MVQALTIEDLKRQYGGPENRNGSDKAGIESAVAPYKDGNSGICITPGGQIMDENSSEMNRLKSNDPDIQKRLQTVQDIQRDY